MTANPVLITGAAQRVGLHLVHRFLEQGRPVIMTYRQHRKQIDQLTAQGVRCIQADFATDDGIAALVSALSGQPLGAIIHNASSWDLEADIHDAARHFDAMMQVHAKAPYLLNRHLAGQIEDGGSIIHITDYTVEKGSDRHIAYVASKAALSSLTLSFAKLLGPRVRVNSIAPSLIIFNEDDDAQYKAKTLAKSVMGIEPGCDEIWLAVHYLLNSRYVTGRTLHVDGGRHIR
ncbi:dihydromonapterin reductase [Gallaecimonas pentaromativorans]|uniref:dihydromonapterin reductase n=1 Tax=Gallaecimonas pentaromativorans TaxID=584787 RepID=UPI00067F59BD|nr:dihydromonapterin reductase [Gallaecimonas pentaromativorans]MED5525569.1 dihydromonapterin reductase [Pseudomonadota bacterium]